MFYYCKQSSRQDISTIYATLSENVYFKFSGESSAKKYYNIYNLPLLDYHLFVKNVGNVASSMPS